MKALTAVMLIQTRYIHVYNKYLTFRQQERSMLIGVTPWNGSHHHRHSCETEKMLIADLCVHVCLCGLHTCVFVYYPKQVCR